MAYDFDLITLGGGSGGVRASRLAAARGASVAVVEERWLGGTCVNVGCIPKKLLVYASKHGEAFADAAGFGWTVEAPGFDWRRLLANKDIEISRLNGVYRRLLEASGAKIVDGRARLVDGHTVEVGGQRLTAEHILIATGGRPTRPAIPGAELGIISDQAFFLPELPRRVLLVGGGYIGVEFAGIFHGLGSQVTLVHRGACVLRGFDDEICHGLMREMRARGIELRLETTVDRVAKVRTFGAALRAELSTGASIETDIVFFATGRESNTRGMGLEEAGVALSPLGAVRVDAYGQTSVPSVWAVGDVTDRLNLTPVALAEAVAFVRTVFGGARASVDRERVPTAVFGQPALAAVGLTEEEARRRYGTVDVYRAAFRPLHATLSGRDEKTLVKLVVDPKTDRVLGCHMLGDDAPEVIQGLAVALTAGATKQDFDATIGIHPTAAEEFVTLREKV